PLQRAERERALIGPLLPSVANLPSVQRNPDKVRRLPRGAMHPLNRARLQIVAADAGNRRPHEVARPAVRQGGDVEKRLTIHVGSLAGDAADRGWSVER